jgi:hypothetical protein
LNGGLEQGRVFARRLGIVNGTGANQDQQAAISPIENIDDLSSRVEDGCRGSFADRVFLLKKDGGKDDFGPLDANVFSSVEHGSLSCCAHPNPLKKPSDEPRRHLFKIYQGRPKAR